VGNVEEVVVRLDASWILREPGEEILEPHKGIVSETQWPSSPQEHKDPLSSHR